MYTSAFGLRELPFNITPDPRFFYTDSGHKEAYATLLYGIRERKGCIALIGEAGTGKTTLLHRVMSDLETTIHTAFFYDTTLTFDELLDFVCSEFSLRVKTQRRLEKLLALRGSPETFRRQLHSEIHVGRTERVCGASGASG